MRIALLLPALLLVSPAVAQDSSTAGNLLSRLGGGTGGAAGGLGSLGGMIPGVGSAGTGNLTGLLGYCVRNQLLGAADTGTTTGGASGLLGKLTGKPGVAQSPGYRSGEQGVLQSGGRSLSLDPLGDGIKQQVCRQVLTRAKGMAGR